MGLKGAEIFFDNPYHTYYAGQTISGRVEILLDSPKKIKGKKKKLVTLTYVYFIIFKYCWVYDSKCYCV